MSVISVAMQKGGSGKTTTALNLAAALREMGQRVLLLDLDPQSNLTQALGIADRVGASIYNAIKSEANGEPTDLHQWLMTVHGLDIVPASLELSEAELELVSAYGREHFLRNLLAPLLPAYDHVVIDCPPAVGMLTVNALVASDWVLLPLQAEFLPMKGVESFLRSFDKISKRMNPGLRILGMVVTRYDQRIGMTHSVVADLEQRFGALVFSTRIRTNTALAKAQEKGMDIFTYDNLSNGALNYMSLAYEVLERVGKVRLMRVDNG